MLPLADCPTETLRCLTAALCDIDDTLTWQGKLPAAAYQALEQLSDLGLIVIPITGRPAGWCGHIARLWRVAGIVGENGAVYFHYDQPSRKMFRRHWRSRQQREQDQRKLKILAQRVLQAVPGTAIASDQAYRESDLAIDFREDVAPLEMEQAEQIVRMFEAAGATAKISSIHVNGWSGDFDKLAMTRLMLQQVFSINIDSCAQTIAFVGDSPNDAPMFSFFPNAEGVANVRLCADSLTCPPRWGTERCGGYGFAEFANAVAAAKS